MMMKQARKDWSSKQCNPGRIAQKLVGRLRPKPRIARAKLCGCGDSLMKSPFHISRKVPLSLSRERTKHQLPSPVRSPKFNFILPQQRERSSFPKMKTAFVIISAYSRCHEKRREPAQPQRLRWQNRGLGAEPTNKHFAKLIKFALLATISRIRNNYYALGLLSTVPAERQNRTHKKNNFKS